MCRRDVYEQLKNSLFCSLKESDEEGEIKKQKYIYIERERERRRERRREMEHSAGEQTKRRKEAGRSIVVVEQKATWY